MHAQQLIERLIRGTIHRAIRESIAGLFVLVAFGYILPNFAAGSARYYGCLLVLVSAGFIFGVIWAFTLSYRLLRTHPASDSSFWHEAFMTQVRLLRLVPLWYLAPICTGILLFIAPTAYGQFVAYLKQLVMVIAMFGGITWLNRYAAAKIEEDAQRLLG